MIEVTSAHTRNGGIAHLGSQPIALAAGALIVIVLGVGSIALWRAYTRTAPEPGPRPPPPPIAGQDRTSLRAACGEDQGAGSHPAGIDRPAAGGPGSVANHETAAG